MKDSSFDIAYPVARDSGVVFASPHSGRDYPPAFVGQSQLDLAQLRSSEDAFVDQLFAGVPDFGAPFLRALKPRAYVDLNRSPDDLDPALIEGVARGASNPRVLSGLGVIPRVVAAGRVIRRGRISRAEADARLHETWYPYHAALRQLLDGARAVSGRALLVDCHSMPHEALLAHFSGSKARPQIVLGDRYGASCASDLFDAVEAAFCDAGFRVARNAPFAGAYVTQAYGRPSTGVSVVQVEIDRALYMDETALRPNAAFADVARALTRASAQIAGLLKAAPGALAAE